MSGGRRTFDSLIVGCMQKRTSYENDTDINIENETLHK